MDKQYVVTVEFYATAKSPEDAEKQVVARLENVACLPRSTFAVKMIKQK